MAFSEFRDTLSWQTAVDLGPQLTRLAEDLPAGEQMGLALQMRQEMVGLIGGIGLDMLEGQGFTRRRHAVRLLAILDLIDKVYPALDTSDAHTAVQKLLDRLTSDQFTERKPGAPAPALAPVPAADPTPTKVAVAASDPTDASGADSDDQGA